MKNNVLEEMIRFQTDRGLDKQEFNLKKCVINILSEIYEMYGFSGKSGEAKAEELFETEFYKYLNPTNDKVVLDSLFDISEFSLGDIMKLGYNPIIVCEEGAKHINSGTGEIIDGKFQKKERDYEPNYDRAKL